MGRIKNDGRGRLGGRAKGTPNREFDLQEWGADIIKRLRYDIAWNAETIHTRQTSSADASAILCAALLISDAIREQTAAILSANGGNCADETDEPQQEPNRNQTETKNV